MSESIKLFPATAIEAVAYLYVQSQNLTGLSPAEINTMYLEAVRDVKRDTAEKRKTGWFKDPKEAY